MIKYINKTKLALIGGILTAGLVTTSCDKGFVELNTNPNAVTDPILENLFTYNVVKTAGTGYENHRGNLIYAGAMIQHFASLNTYWSGDKYLSNVEYYSAYFETAYTNQVKEIEQIIALTKDNPELSNKYNIARIWRAFIYHRITDLYGDIPYSEAGQGFLGTILSPKYDTQQSIYADMLKELEEASAGLDASKATYGPADPLFGGDVAKWKKFGYSMMLRLGMRLTKADAANAQNYVKKAIAGGVMTSNSDIARLLHYDTGNDNNRNLDANTLKTQEYDAANLKGKANSKLSQTFVDFLKSNNDPRLPYIATLWEGNADRNALPTASAPAVQKGLPNGYDPTTIKTLIPSWNDNSLATYSEANLNYVANNAAPTVFQSYAEVEYLLAEAALRGWGDGDAAGHYNKGVTAAMSMFSIYGANIPATAITAYLAAHPFVTTGMAAQMEQIHTQYWAVNFLNSYEAYADWRRTGYPTLKPTNYPGNATGGVIPRRLRYPASETSKNADNYRAAVAIQGPDDFLTKVWWDK
ncbi:SusD/RagB family nutrient-binding outer membrane lipoprotein [Dyadobacter sp.]|uniref:SusD/RagB family nutrient-binding outer membrane lipoprotein n=1 Tax=Dyadobacter sp. TaxID=1914288 RepID=UPI003F7144C3